MKRSIISILVAGLCAGAATAVLAADEDVKTSPKPAETSQSRASDQNSHESMHEKGAADFKRADKDHDGTLDRKEAKKMPRVAKNFDAIDTDNEGTVSLMEIHAYMKDHPAGGKK